MTDYDFSPGSTFLLPTRIQDIPHLWVVLTYPDKNSNEVVIVNLTTKRSHSDTTVILNPGDHPFINRETVINYSDAKFVKVENLKKALDMTLAEPHSHFRNDILEIIQKGVLKSPHTPLKVKKYCQKKFSNQP